MFINNSGSEVVSPDIQAEKVDFSAVYKIEKINEINDKILNRYIVEDSYFFYISDDTDLTNDVKRYNEMTSELKGYFTNVGVDIAYSIYSDMGGIVPDSGEGFGKRYFELYYKISPEIHELEGIIANAALYKNCEQLLFAEPKLAYFLERGKGGSLALWPSSIQNENGSFDNPMMDDLNEYFSLIDDLLSELDVYRSSMSIIC